MTGPYPVEFYLAAHEKWNPEKNEYDHFMTLTAHFRHKAHRVASRSCSAWEASTSEGFDQAARALMEEAFS